MPSFCIVIILILIIICNICAVVSSPQYLSERIYSIGVVVNVKTKLAELPTIGFSTKIKLCSLNIWSISSCNTDISVITPKASNISFISSHLARAILINSSSLSG